MLLKTRLELCVRLPNIKYWQLTSTNNYEFLHQTIAKSFGKTNETSIYKK